MKNSGTLAVADSQWQIENAAAKDFDTAQKLDDLACPRCAGRLSQDTESAQCSACNVSYPIADGIIDLRCGRHDYYFNPIPPARMEELIRTMSVDSWPRTVREFIRAARMNASWLDNLVVDGRYSWKVFLNLRKNSTVLDLGCGLGNLTHNVAPLVKRVYAMDLTFPRLQFSRKRFSLFNKNDDIVALAAGDGTHLPFRSGTLDCVIVSGVLEWVGEGDTTPFDKGSKLARLLCMLKFQFGEHDPRRIQLNFLREIRRILKPSGQLFVAIENRLNYEYFTGRRDHHSLLYYGSLLPRWLATLYSIAASRKPYRTYTYSIPGYRKLLTEAGFPNVEFLGLSRGYSALEEIMPSEVAAPNWKPDSPGNLQERIRRNKYFVPAYGIVSSTECTPWPRRLDAALAAAERLARARFGQADMIQHSCTVSRDQKLVIRSSYGAHGLITRLPMNGAARASEESNAAVLRALASADPVSGAIPIHLGSGEADGIWYSSEAELAGRPLAAELTETTRELCLPQIVDLLDRLRASSPATRCRLEGDVYHGHVARWLSDVHLVLDDPDLSAWAEAYFRRELYGLDVPLGIMHGDFGPSSILLRDLQITGLVHWENGELQGLPILDAITYLTGVQQALSPSIPLAQVSSLLASEQWPNRRERDFLSNRYAALGIDVSRHACWVHLAWLRQICHRLKNTLQFDPALLEREVVGGLKSILARAEVRIS